MREEEQTVFQFLKVGFNNPSIQAKNRQGSHTFD
jgi:hypothetical protein